MCVCLFNIDLWFLVDFTGTGYFPLLSDGLLSGGSLVLLQLPKNIPLDHQHLQIGFFLLFQGLISVQVILFAFTHVQQTRGLP